MCPHETDVDSLKAVLDLDYQTVSIATNVEYGPIIGEEIGTGKDALDI